MCVPCGDRTAIRWGLGLRIAMVSLARFVTPTQLDIHDGDCPSSLSPSSRWLTSAAGPHWELFSYKLHLRYLHAMRERNLQPTHFARKIRIATHMIAGGDMSNRAARFPKFGTMFTDRIPFVHLCEHCFL